MATQPVTRRALAAAILYGLAASSLPFAAHAQVPEHGPPLAVVTLRIGPADDAGFLHDLSDYIQRYGFDVTGEPGGEVVDGRPVFLAWFKRQDGVVMLVTDISAPEKMQAFFYGRKDGTAGDQTVELVKAYTGKMSSYKAFQ
jgi:hypothetical protein